MASYKLEVTFTPAQLEAIYATGSRVILAHSVMGSLPNVVWQAFNPFQSNLITWEDQFGIYCSNASFTNGTLLTSLATVPIGADMNAFYNLESNGVIAGPSSGGQPDTFSLLNNYSNSPYILAGLQQDAVINGVEVQGNAISALPTLFQSTAFMLPTTSIYIWLQSQVESNSVITRIASPLTQLDFGGSVDAISVQYDSEAGIFTIVS
jgi:hypothetical protein